MGNFYVKKYIKNTCILYFYVLQYKHNKKGGDIVSELFTTSRTAQILDISTQTLKRWYKWYNSTDFEKPKELKLPEPKTDRKNTMLFTMEQIQELHQFQIDLNSKYRGIMAEFNATYQWGQRGTKILNIGKQYKKKEENNEEKKCI